MKEGRPGYMVTVIPVVIGALGGGIKKTISELSRLITKRDVVLRTVSEMQKTILMDNESIIRKVMSGLVQGDEDETCETLGPWPNVTKADIISILKLYGFSYPCHAMAKDKGQRPVHNIVQVAIQ